MLSQGRFDRSAPAGDPPLLTDVVAKVPDLPLTYRPTLRTRQWLTRTVSASLRAHLPELAQRSIRAALGTRDAQSERP